MKSQDDLTPSQRRAVEHTEGPVLVLAGPGSGKTRVITRRIARVIESGVDPGRVLAITFTNKAAGEMSGRVAQILPGTRVRISTFHRFCARLLRQRADAVGLKPNFTILDADDQRRIVRDVVKDLNYDVVHFPPPAIAERISRAKNDLQTAEVFQRVRQERVGSHLDSVVARVYPEYQRRLLDSNSVDFDDLLLHVVQMLKENPELRAGLDDQFRYVLVDEYQDTNLAQYQIVAALSRDYPNLCVTGDPDQSIYGWRGARIENILRFEADYPHAAVIRLEENFRSTKSILRAADRLIAFNARRKSKTMRTENPDGPPVELLSFDDASAEAEGIAHAIRAGVRSREKPGRWSDFAIFYRVNALSRELELALARHKIPFQVAAGLAFYERAEVKDVLAYLRLLYNPRDRAAFLRVVNVPARGIGKQSLGRLVAWADAAGVTLMEAAAGAHKCPGISQKSARGLSAFAVMIEELGSTRIESLREFLERVLDRTGYARQWEHSTDAQAQERLANVGELVNAAQQYDASNSENPTLGGFLETTALVADVDHVDGVADRVTLMTLHSAKGLEFSVVYLVGVEHGLLPHERSLRADDPGELEEERRLAFVGMTRAKERLFLTRAKQRAVRGRTSSTIHSEFLRELGLAETVFTTPGIAWSSQNTEELPDRPHADADVECHQEVRWEDIPQHDGETVQVAEPSSREATAKRKPPLMMTGADLLNQAVARGADLPRGFAVGMSVRHPQYGVGRVVTVSGFAKNRTITVEFADDGHRATFLAGKNPLQPVGAG